MAKVVMATRGSFGDVVPFLAIGAALRARGHHVTLLTHCHYASAAATLGLSFGSWDTPSQFRRSIADGPLLDTPVGAVTFARRHLLPHVADEHRLIVEHAKAGSTVIVARHMNLTAWFAAESLGAPLVSVFTAVAQVNCWSFFRHLCEVLLRRELSDSRRCVGLNEVTSWPDWFGLPSMFLGCWPVWFAEPMPAWPGAVAPLGFLRSDETEEGQLPDALESWLDAGTPPVLITGGTARWALSERFYESAIAGCERAGQRAIVVCPHDDVARVEEQDDVVRYQRLPFATLASRLAGIIHHGGTSVLIRAMVSNLPQLLMPYGADRPDTAERVVKTGVAASLPPPLWRPEIVSDRLSRLLASERVRDRCRCLSALARADNTALAMACRSIERLVH